ncbi:MAG TPA: cysteine hydrolase family protein [Bryobacteraceae bacterium]|nr:cysteine hydrolase family protein [Bryobacteraceae bacterium]
MNTVFVDVDTQLDFLCPAGALYALGAEKVAPALAALTSYAAEHGIKIVSTIDAHTENDPEFQIWKPHCVAGTAGQQKISLSLLEKRCVIPNEGQFDDAAANASQQVIVEKQTVDPFTNAHLVSVVQSLHPCRFVVYGLVTEVCIHHAVLGLLRHNPTVEIVTDAIRPFSETAGEQAIIKLVAAGAKLTNVAAITG